MLPLEIEKRIENPGLLENQFIQYLIAGNWPIDQSKSIAYESYIGSTMEIRVSN